MNKIIEVAFGNQNLKSAYFKLKEGKFEEKQLSEFIDRAINDLKINPFCGIKIPRRLWPKEYIKKSFGFEFDLKTAFQYGAIIFVPFLIKYSYNKKYKEGIPHPNFAGQFITDDFYRDF